MQRLLQIAFWTNVAMAVVNTALDADAKLVLLNISAAALCMVAMLVRAKP